jgi:hypothetical protein
MFQDSLKRAIAELTIARVAQLLDLPATIPNGNCVISSPLRPDKHPSFSVYAGGKRWRDFATNEGGDSYDFFKAATGLTGRSAVEAFLRLRSQRHGLTFSALGSMSAGFE